MSKQARIIADLKEALTTIRDGAWDCERAEDALPGERRAWAAIRKIANAALKRADL